MHISGLQKMTLLDFPGKVACTVFLHGCNYRCPFCHNSEFLEGKPEEVMTQAEFLDFLKKRVGLLDGVCVSGGEPTLSPELETLLRRIKALGFAVKLDTNGSRPEVLKALVAAGLVDYVAMDIKNSPGRYARTCGISRVELAAIAESAAFLSSGAVASEFRTTVVLPLHDRDSLAEMGQWLHNICATKTGQKLYLQQFVDRNTVAFSGLQSPEAGQMEEFAELLRKFDFEVFVRG